MTPRVDIPHLDDGTRAGPGLLRRTLFGTDMPAWLVLALVAPGLPRTVLADLGVVEPEGSWVYYVLALAPFAAWLAVATCRRSASPIRDHLLVGAAYGLSLVVVHEALWSAGSSLGHHPAPGATELAARVGPPLHDLVLHGYAFATAMAIGLGAGMVAGLVATAAAAVRAVRSR